MYLYNLTYKNSFFQKVKHVCDEAGLHKFLKASYRQPHFFTLQSVRKKPCKIMAKITMNGKWLQQL